MNKEIRDEFWHAFEDSPFIMMKLDASREHSEPMTAQLDRDAHHAIWFYCSQDNRIAAGGPVMGQFVAKGHDVFACLAGNIAVEEDRAVFEKHWSNQVEAWFPGGKTDPKVMMLRFDIADAEVWTSDFSLKGKVKLLTGKTIEPGEAGEHAIGKV